MQTSDNAALAALYSLLRVGEDSAAGYATAARDASDAELSRLLRRIHDERVKIVAHLRERIRQFRGDAEVGSSVSGMVHRTWIDFRSATAEEPDRALLTEIERGERLAVDTYCAALKQTGLDPLTARLLQHQYERVQIALDRVSQLRNRIDAPRAKP